MRSWIVLDTLNRWRWRYTDSVDNLSRSVRLRFIHFIYFIHLTRRFYLPINAFHWKWT